jgi:hypothetical protein
MRLERSAITMAVTLGLVIAVVSVLAALSDPAHAQVDSSAFSEFPGGSGSPILSATAPRAGARPATLSASRDASVGFQKVLLPSGRLLPPTAKSPDSPEAFSNGDFESGPDGSWLEASAYGYPLILHTTMPREGFTLPSYVPPRSGEWAVWLGGDPYEVSYIRQPVDVTASRMTLGFWMWIDSRDECGCDFGKVVVRDDTVVDVFPLCEEWNTFQWVKREVHIAACHPQTLAFQIRAETDGSLSSDLFIDDLTLDVEPIECARLYLPLVTRQKGGSPPDAYVASRDAGGNTCEPCDSCPTAYGPLKPGYSYGSYPEDRSDSAPLVFSDAGSVAIKVTDAFEN